MAQMKKGVTVGILAKNEEKNIARCIESACCFADEIIVLDNGSTDRTKDIALNNGARVLSAINFSEATLRNLILSKSNYSWTFFLDADERATMQFGNALKKAINTEDHSIVALKVPVNSYFGKGLWANYLLFKCVKNGVGVHFDEGAIHPSIGKSVNSCGRSEIVPCEIHHFDALIKGRAAQKRNDYVERIKREINNHQNDPIEKNRLRIYLGLEYTSVGNYNTANNLYIQAANELAGHSHAVFSQILLMQNYMLLKQYSEVDGVLKRILGDSFENNLLSNSFSEVAAELKNRSNLSDGFLQQCLVILEKLNFDRKKYDEARCWAKFSLALWPFVSFPYLNLALLSDENEAKILVREAINLNPLLKNDIIYQEGFSPNLYVSQCSLIDKPETILRKSGS